MFAKYSSIRMKASKVAIGDKIERVAGADKIWVEIVEVAPYRKSIIFKLADGTLDHRNFAANVHVRRELI